VEAAADYDDQDHTVSYRVGIEEGRTFNFGKLVLTGLSPTAERPIACRVADIDRRCF